MPGRNGMGDTARSVSEPLFARTKDCISGIVLAPPVMRCGGWNWQSFWWCYRYVRIVPQGK